MWPSSSGKQQGLLDHPGLSARQTKPVPSLRWQTPFSTLQTNLPIATHHSPAIVYATHRRRNVNRVGTAYPRLRKHLCLPRSTCLSTSISIQESRLNAAPRWVRNVLPIGDS